MILFHRLYFPPFSLKDFIVAFIISFLPVKTWAQNDTLFFWHHDTHEKMTNNNVSGIIQDSLGYMWYGTQEGLNKYDGYGFKPYLHDSKNINSLASDDITCISTRSDGIIWIGTSGKGLNQYNTYTNKWVLYQHRTNDINSIIQDSITSIFADSSGLIWIGTASQGLHLITFNGSSIQSIMFHPDPGSI
ncbi:MAG: two-component regulator propeller domain-containing protein [Chitinophagales bacterium]